jgi:hypothetical protein
METYLKRFESDGAKNFITMVLLGGPEVALDSLLNKGRTKQPSNGLDAVEDGVQVISELCSVLGKME